MRFGIANLRSLNLRLSALVLLLVLLAMSVIVLYVDHATYSLTRELQQNSLEQLSSSSLEALSDSLEDNLDMVRVVASQRAIKEALRGEDKGENAHHRTQDYLKQYESLWAMFVFDLDGKIVAGATAAGNDLRGQDRSHIDTIKAVLSGKDAAISPAVAKSDTESKMVYRLAAAVKDESGRIIGGVLGSIDLNVFSKSLIDKITVGRSGYAFMLDAEGRFIAHSRDKTLLLKNIKEEVPTLGEALRMKNGFTEYTFHGQAKMLAFRQHDGTGWIIGVCLPTDEATAAATSIRTAVALIGAGVCLALVAMLVVTIRRMIVRPLTAIERFAAEIADGSYHTELTGRFTCELADLAASIRTMKDNIKRELGFARGVLKGIPTPCGIVGPDHTMVWANEHVCALLGKPEPPEKYLGLKSGEFYLGDPERETLSDKAIKRKEPLAAQTEWTSPDGSRKLNIQINTTPFYDMDGHLLGSISFWHDITEIVVKQKTIEAQRDRIAEAARMADTISDKLATAAEEIFAQIEESSRGSEHQKQRIGETATAIEQMNASILEVARSSGDAAGSADSAREKASAGSLAVGESISAIQSVQTQVRRMKDGLTGLGQKAESIGAIMQIIEDIADQTNLLALNAAIEAARAGDAGRGFAVVADEVRKLAEKTMGATKDVGAAIREIQTGTRHNIGEMDNAVVRVEESVGLTERAGEALQEIVQVALGTADMVRSIATAAEQQSAASEQIARSADEVNVIATETADAMSQSSQAVSDLARMAGELKEIIARMQN